MRTGVFRNGGTLKRHLVFVVIAAVAGVVTVPVSSWILWEMRPSFVGDYEALKARCESLSGLSINEEEERTAAAWPDRAEMSRHLPCVQLGESLAVFREARFGRCIGFGVVVFIGLVIVRFVVFADGFGRRPEDEE